jgi:ComF family protein
MDELQQEQIICDACESSLPFTHFDQMQNNPIEKIFWGRVAIKQAIAVLYFTKESIVQQIIVELKYKQNKKAGHLLGRLLAKELMNNPKFSQIDYLIPIPISKRKIKKRGFNQSLIICEAMVWCGYAIPIFSGLLKSKEGLTQTHKDRIERAKQTNTLFSLVQMDQLKGKHLLVIDDVITTGSTLEAACACLMEAQPASIQIAAAAYTYH